MTNSEQPAFGFLGTGKEYDYGANYKDVPKNFPGLSKLEYFAGLAMQGLLANGEVKKEIDAAFKFIEEKGELKNDIPFVYASMAMDFAKALIAEIKKESNQ